MSGQTRMMLPDAQEVVCKEIFRGALPCEVEEWFQDDMGQECVFHIFDRSPEMVKAALVCKSWNAAYKDYVKAFFAEEDRKFRQTVIVNALAMCGLARYNAAHVGEVGEHTQEYHAMVFRKWDQEAYLASFVLTRWKPEGEDVHTLHMEYGARTLDACMVMGTIDQPAEGVRLTQIPAVCFEHPAEPDKEQAWQEWREDFIWRTEEWLALKGQQQPSVDEANAIAQYDEVYGAWHKTWLAERKEQTQSE